MRRSARRRSSARSTSTDSDDGVAIAHRGWARSVSQDSCGAMARAAATALRTRPGDMPLTSAMPSASQPPPKASAAARRERGESRSSMLGVVGVTLRGSDRTSSRVSCSSTTTSSLCACAVGRRAMAATTVATAASWSPVIWCASRSRAGAADRTRARAVEWCAAPRKSSAHLLAGALEVLAALHHASSHPGLGAFAVGARVVDLLVADLAVDLQHPVIVLEHVIGHGPGEGVLRVRVDVHLDDAVGQRLVDLFEQRSAAAVEDEIEGVLLAELGADVLLALFEDGRLELDRAGLVDPVHVSEHSSKQIAAALSGCAQHLGNTPHVLG